MEKNNGLTEEVRKLNIEQEAQPVLLYEVTEWKTKSKEDKVVIEDDKRTMTNRLEGRTSDVQNLANI